MLACVLYKADLSLEVTVDQLVCSRLAPRVERWQLVFFKRVNVLTELHGRGYFYLFIGTLAASECLICGFFIGGVLNLFMGMVW